MKVFVNGKEINAIECKEVFDYGIRDLVIVVEQGEMSYDEFKNLFKENKEIDGDIIAEFEEATVTYCGYSKSATFTEKEDTYTVSLACLPPIEKSVSELASKVNAQETEVAGLETAVNALLGV